MFYFVNEHARLIAVTMNAKWVWNHGGYRMIYRRKALELGYPRIMV
jgi:hypothetical protein